MDGVEAFIYWTILLNDGVTWVLISCWMVGCEKDWCGNWSILCFLSFQHRDRYLLPDYSILSSTKKKKKKEVRERFIQAFIGVYTSNEDGDLCAMWDEFKHLEWILKLVRWGSAIWTKINWQKMIILSDVTWF